MVQGGVVEEKWGKGKGGQGRGGRETVGGM